MSENQTTENVTVTEPVNFSLGDIVRVSDAAVAAGRSFDFGNISKVNKDGTFAVLWDGAGCACMGIPNENADQLTLATREDQHSHWEGTYLIPNGPDGTPAIASPVLFIGVDDNDILVSIGDDDDDEDYDDDDYSYEEEDEEDDSEGFAVFPQAPVEFTEPVPAFSDAYSR